MLLVYVVSFPEVMSSSASNIESLTPTSRGSPVFSLIITHKWKLVLSVALLLGAVAAIGVCAAAVSVTSTGAGRETTDSTRSVHSQEINGEASEVSSNTVCGMAVIECGQDESILDAE